MNARTPILPPTVTRGRIVGRDGMYASTVQTQSVNSGSPAWYEDIQDELNVNHHETLSAKRRLLQRQDNLDLKRQVRRKFGKHEDTEGMVIEQEKINRVKREIVRESELSEMRHKSAMRDGKTLLFLLLLLVTISTPFAVVGIVLLFWHLTHRG